MNKEVWKNISDFPGYEISSDGRVRSFRDCHGNITDKYKILKATINKDGYYEITLYQNTKKVTKRIHRLVACAFYGNHPGLVVNHINGIKTDNRVSNLEFVTPQKNSSLTAEMGLYKTRRIKIKETGEIFDSVKSCANKLKVHPSDINHAISGSRSSAKGYHFEYVDRTTSFLYDYQLDAVNRLHNGCILCGSVGSGKSRTGLFYYYKENDGWLDNCNPIPMKNKPQDLYIITTAKKRDTLEWNRELANFGLSTDPKQNMFYGNIVVVDSWNNISKYTNIKNAFFLLDEQRIVGNGTWVKSFLKIAKNNNWILLTGTPGDSYMDYVPVFLANGYFKNRTEFNREHVVYSQFSKYPKIEKYINTQRLDRLRNRVLVKMNYTHDINIHHEDVYCKFNPKLYNDIFKKRWNIFHDKPIEQASEMCYVLRQLVNTDESREIALLELLEEHPRVIIFYNFNYELELLRHLFWCNDGVEENPLSGFEVAEYNGQRHQDVPNGKKWAYLCQYTAACEGWECIKTDTIIFYSQNYSYKVMTQAAGRIDRLNTPFNNLYYYHLKSKSGIDIAISRALEQKKTFNERSYIHD